MDSPILIVGLGNPGMNYASTLHNLGFQVVDNLSKRWGVEKFLKKFHGLLAQATFASKKVLLLKPQTFMNLSGRSVGEAVNFYKVDMATQLLLLSDDLDMPPGALRIRSAGGSGGHNGLKSVIETLGGENFSRIRIGIGRSAQLATVEHLFSKLSQEEKTLFSNAIEQASLAVESFIREGVQKTMNAFNKRGTDES